MQTIGERVQRNGARSIRMVALMLLALGVLLALAPVLAGDRADASGDPLVTAALDAGSAGIEAAAHSDHGDVACHGGSGCTATATLPDGVILAVFGTAQQHFGPGSSTWLARPVRPDIKPPIL